MRTPLAVALVVAALIGSVVACGGDGVSRTLGARCAITADCEDRCLTPSNDFPDGFCTLDCSDERDCPSEAECVDKEGGVCLVTCGDDFDCGFLGPTWVCRDEPARADQNRKVRVCRGE